LRLLRGYLPIERFAGMAVRKTMAEASDLVLDGLMLRSDVNVVRHPDRYSDKWGAEMWNRVMGLLASTEVKA
jgi:hypothetical protein